MEDISKKIRFILQTRGISYSEAAERLGLVRDHFQDILDGREVPTPRIIRILAEVCNVKPDFFTGKSEAPGADDTASANSKPEDVTKTRGGSTLKDLALRYQALVECLVEHEVITASQLKEKVEALSARAAERSKVKKTKRKRPSPSRR